MTPIILLDLNFTLVENSDRRGTLARSGRYMEWVERYEKYRGWLVDLIREHYVIMITARTEKYRDASLRSIFRETGWLPQESLFAPQTMPPHEWKPDALRRRVFPVHGEPGPDVLYLGLESNVLTRAAYSQIGVFSADARLFTEPYSLPEVPAVVEPFVASREIVRRRKRDEGQSYLF